MALSSNALSPLATHAENGSTAIISGGETIRTANIQIHVHSGTATFVVQDGMDANHMLDHAGATTVTMGPGVYVLRAIPEPNQLIRLRWELFDPAVPVEFEASILGKT